MIDSNRVEVPVCLREGRRVVTHVVNAAVPAAGDSCILWTIRVIGVHFSSPVATEVCIDDDVHVTEMIINGTSRTLLIDRRLAKLGDVRCSLRNTWWNSTTWKEPVLHIACGPLSDIYTTTVVVQRLSIVVWYRGGFKFRPTAGIVVFLVVAIRSLQLCSLVAACNTAAIGGVHGYSILSAIVDSLDDVWNILASCQP